MTHPLTPPASYETHSWWAVNATLDTVLYDIPSAPQSTIDDFYTREGNGTLTKLGPVGEDPSSNYSALTEGGELATADLSHVVYETFKSVFSFDPTEFGSLYEYVGAAAAPLQVGVSGGLGSHALVSQCGILLGGRSGTGKRDNSLSEDGRIVYFTAVGEEAGKVCLPAEELYARIDGERPDARTVLISGATPEGCKNGPCIENTTNPADARAASFEGASADGSRVFFTSTQQLSDGASQDSNAGLNAFTRGCNAIGGPGGCNLYESECPNASRCEHPSERRLIDVSEGEGGAPVAEGPRVQGVVAMSSDGSHVYFVADGVLSKASNARGETAQEGADNLYAYAEGKLTFIARLSPGDEREWTQSDLIANVTPDGRLLVFTSHRALTLDDTREEGPAQVFKYDSLTHTMTRVSVGEGGFNNNGNQGSGDGGIALPQFGVSDGTVPLRTDPTMSDDGAFVFFMSPNALTPGALNDVLTGSGQLAQNVYEYHDGHVSLISDGRDTAGNSEILGLSAVELLGSDRSGANVFFTTFDRLVPEDVDTARDIYDARGCTSGEPCGLPMGEPVSCAEGDCQAHGGSPATPLGSGSEAFFGSGNVVSPAVSPPVKPPPSPAQLLAKALRKCAAKHDKRKRAACVAAARKRYAPAHKAKKSSHGRGSKPRGANSSQGRGAGSSRGLRWGGV
jgi:hypothetical protein